MLDREKYIISLNNYLLPSSFFASFPSISSEPLKGSIHSNYKIKIKAASSDEQALATCRGTGGTPIDAARHNETGTDACNKSLRQTIRNFERVRGLTVGGGEHCH